MKRAPNPKTFAIMAAATFVLGTGACYFAFTQSNEVSDRVSKLRSEVKSATDIQTELEQSQASLDECRTKLTHLEANVPSFAYVPALLTELESIGKQNGIKVMGVRPVQKLNAPKPKDDRPARKSYEELNIEVKGQGSYRSVLNFVNALRKFPKIVAARTITIVPKVEPNQATQSLECIVELRAYMFAGQQAPAPKPVDKTAQVEGKRHAG